MKRHHQKHGTFAFRKSINNGIITFVVLFFLFNSLTYAAIEAEVNGKVYGNPDGLSRVETLESQIRNLSITQSHPRIVLTPELIARARSRVKAAHPSWVSIKARANAGSIVNSAFAYLMLKDSDSPQAKIWADKVVELILNADEDTWIETQKGNTGFDRSVGEWALGFDWAYDGISDQARKTIIDKIALKSNIAGRAQWIRDGNTQLGETFHRESWIFYSYRAWPEIALAHHHKDAEFCYQSRWKNNWYWGDAARMYAYLADGTPLEGYQYGAGGIGWFMALKSATGINLIDSTDFPYFRESADYQFYSADFGRNRNIFHHGVGLGAAGVVSYEGETNWKIKEYHKRAAQLIAHKNPYQQWFLDNILDGDASPWIFTNDYYRKWNDIEDISQLIFYDNSLPSSNPKTASYDQLPYSRLFPGGNEVYMRSSWSDNAAMACFRTAPALTKSSHGDFDVNTFLLYRKGVLSPDSGVYDHIWGQKNYFQYQKNTISHNNMLIVDPSRPDHPIKLSNSPDLGGVERISTRNFGYDYGFGQHTVFVHNENAEWGDIIEFESNVYYDYAVGDAAKAYGDRCDEYLRHLVFIRRPGDKAYVVVFDRVNATQSNYKKKWLLHLVEEPQINGSVVSTEVPNHIVSYDGDTYTSTNAFNNSALYGKVLLPQNHTIRKVGGEGYRFYVESSNPVNWGLDWESVAANKEPYMGGVLEEIGQWRIELMPNAQQKMDYFMNIIYMGDVGETLVPIELINDGGQFGCRFSKGDFSAEVRFNKFGDSGGSIKLMENGSILIDRNFSSPPKPLNMRVIQKK